MKADAAPQGVLRKTWHVSPLISDVARAALQRWQAEPVLQQLFFNRGICTEAEAMAFVQRSAPDEGDVRLLPDMAVAVERVVAAIERHERIVIYGDYDVDGVTATALLVLHLQQHNADVHPYIPHRELEGYGLNNAAFDEIAAAGTKLVISVDCGVRSLLEADHARNLGMDLIITDHHSVGATLPRALAVINPKRLDHTYPERNLSGVGLAYKFVQALQQRLPLAASAAQGDTLLDLVALGSVADLAPLSGENRALVWRGLQCINQQPRAGIAALLAAARRRIGTVDAGTIAFQLGPRLNAAGRLNTALDAYQLLVTADVAEAEQLAQALEMLNRERQQQTAEITQRALQQALAGGADQLILFAVDESFNSGIVGLAAARVQEQTYRPVLVAQREPDQIRGSARSIAEFHITEALDACADLLVRYGGHAAAAGFTLVPGNWEAFVQRLRAIAQDKLHGLVLRPHLRIDAEVGIADLAGRLGRQMEFFEPTGYGNPAPVFAARNVSVQSVRRMGTDGQHMKLRLQQAGSATVEAVAFGEGAAADSLPQQIDIAFNLELNEWQGKRSVQLRLRDWRPAT